MTKPIFRIAAFDVAIKTLSFCVLEWKGLENKGEDIKNLDFQILEWQLVDLIKQEPKRKCQRCNRVAKWFKHNSDSSSSSSTSTSSSSTSLESGVGYEDIIASLPSIPISYYCTTHQKQYDNCQPIVVKNTTNTSILDIQKELVKQLDRFPILLEVDEIIIENQHAGQGGPSRMINTKMIAISSSIYSYFVIRGINDLTDDKQRIKSISYVAAKANLSTGGGLIDQKEVDQNQDGKAKSNAKSAKRGAKYRQKKALSVNFAKSILNLCKLKETDNWKERLEESGKKDDLADSLTHAFSQMVKIEECKYQDFYTDKWKNNRLKLK